MLKHFKSDLIWHFNVSNLKFMGNSNVLNVFAHFEGKLLLVNEYRMHTIS